MTNQDIAAGTPLELPLGRSPRGASRVGKPAADAPVHGERRSEADLLRSYPSLRAGDLANAWAYARAHRDEIERQIGEDEAA